MKIGTVAKIDSKSGVIVVMVVSATELHEYAKRALVVPCVQGAAEDAFQVEFIFDRERRHAMCLHAQTIPVGNLTPLGGAEMSVVAEVQRRIRLMMDLRSGE